MKVSVGAIRAATSVLGLLLVLGSSSFAADEFETADLLIKLLKTGRTVVSENQALINDPNRADKAFTPEVFGARMIEKFRDQTRIDLNRPNNSLQHRLLLDLVDSGRQVIAQYQPVINKRGIGFKNVLPAVVARKTGERFYAKTGIRLKLTAIDYRYPGNKPDQFEAEVLKMFVDPRYPKGQDYARTIKADGRKMLRVMSPEYASASCLSCHGEPKGDKDITGGRKEGWKEGDFGGAISLVMPVQ